MIRRIFPDPKPIIEYLTRRDPGALARLIGEAERILARDIAPFPGIALRGGFKDWQTDPLSGKRWKVKDGKVARPSADADVKFVWELNRHQYLPVLGKAYAATDDARYAHGAAALMTEWLIQNPPGESINWRSGLEAAVRVISWIWTLSFFPEGSIPAQAAARLRAALDEHADYIGKNLQTRAVPNNHLIGEAAGLFVCGAARAPDEAARSWEETGMRILLEQLFTQVGEDGVDKEQAWDYHRFVMDFYVLAIAVSRAAGKDWPEAALRRVELMHEALLAVVRPDGLMPMTGDDDSARALRLSAEEGRNPAPAFSTGAALFSNPRLKGAARVIHEETLWLLGAAGARSFEAIAAQEPPQASCALKDAGHYVLRSGRDAAAHYLCFDCGPQGMGEAGHGHADALSFELHSLGTTMLIDPGTYIYNRSPRWRNFFRGTAAHNTVLIDGRDQAEHVDRNDPFGWKHKADGKLHDWHSTAYHDYVCASHNGYQRLKAPVIHRRSILFNKEAGYWIVSDLLTGEGRHRAEFMYHAAPDLNVTLKSDGRAELSGTQGHGLVIIPCAPRGLHPRVIEGSERPIQGWASSSYGSKRAAPVVCYRGDVQLPYRADFLLMPIADKNTVETAVHELELAAADPPAPAIAFCINQGDAADYFLDCPAPGEKRFGPCATDASYALASEKSGSCFARDVSYLRIAGKDVFASAEPEAWLSRGPVR